MKIRSIWQKPSLRREEDSGRHRKVSWLELFYDLFFVVTISQLAHILVGEPDKEKVLSYMFLFLPVWWTWIGTTYYLERFESDGLENRLFHFLLLFPVTGIAVSIHDGLGSTSLGLGLSYLSARGIITFLWLRATIHDMQFRPTGIKYIAGFTLSLLIIAVSLFTEPPLRFILWGIAFVTDMITPWFTLREQAKLPRLSTSRLPERFGLLMLIVLGESVVGVVNGLAGMQKTELNALIIAFLAIAASFGFWWTYFDFVGRRPPKPNVYSNITWSYTHLPLAMAIASFGASVTNIIQMGGIMTDWMILHITISAALIFFVTGILETTLKREPNEPAYPVISPLIKFISGIIILTIPLFEITNNPIAIMGTIFGSGLINAIYGAVVWFRSNDDEETVIN